LALKSRTEVSQYPGGGPLAALQALGELPDSGRRDQALPFRAKVNSHVHVPPNFSAFHTVGEAVQMAAEQDVRVLGVSNYYDFGAYGPLAELSMSMGVFPLFGLEVVCLLENLLHSGVRVNDPGNPGKMYLCGKGITRFAPMDAAAATLMDTVRRIDSDRIANMIDKLNGVFAASGVKTSVTEESVKAAVVTRHGVPADTVYLQERHVAQAFQEALFALVPIASRPDALLSLFHANPGANLDSVSVQDAIRANLMKAGKPGYVNEAFVGFDHAFQLVLALGGVPCYPVLADGARPMCEFEESIERLVLSLKQRRIHCAELIPNRNTPEVLGAYARALRAAGITVLAGTEHNTLDLIPIEPRCAGGIPVPDPLKDIFWEGACVIAAHQFRMANGRGGYIDGDGELNPSYPADEVRIEAFAQLGATVIKEYAQPTGAHDISPR
jgi:hypothetical protein